MSLFQCRAPCRNKWFGADIWCESPFFCSGGAKRRDHARDEFRPPLRCVSGAEKETDGEGGADGGDADAERHFVDAAEQKNAELATDYGGDGDV